MKSRALVLLSGGQDSTTCLYWAKKEFGEVHAVAFSYGQRHQVEVRASHRIAEAAGVRSFHLLHVPALKEIGGSALTDSAAPIKERKDDVPTSFVPGRNITFLALAGGLAKVMGVPNLVIGVNEVDYSGYTDCRAEFIMFMQNALSTGLDFPNLLIHTPLLCKTKLEIWRLAEELGILNVIVRDTHTCYEGDHKTFHSWGYGCDQCPACRIRKEGFEGYQRVRQFVQTLAC